MQYYTELKRGPSGRKISEGRIIVQSEDGTRLYGLHTSYPDGFTRLHHLPPRYLEEWCHVTTEKEARRVMPEIFSFLEKYSITDEGEGSYREYLFGTHATDDEDDGVVAHLED